MYSQYLKEVMPYKQINNLTQYCNVLLDYTPCDIKSLFFWFDSTVATVPTNYIQYIDHKICSTDKTVDIVLIIDDKKLHNTYDKDNNHLYYWNSDFVKNNYRNLLRYNTFRAFIGRYILDWKFNNFLKHALKECKSEKIELNYWINKN